MRSVTRRGTSLAEMLVVVMLLGLLLAMLGQLVRVGGQLLGGARASLRTQRDLGALVAALRHAVPGAGTALLAHGLDTLDYDRRVGEGPICASAAGIAWLDATGGGWVRNPDPTRDRVDVLVARDPARWVRVGFAASVADSCAGRPAFRLSLDSVLAPAGWGRVISPVRLRAYRSTAGRALGLEDRPGGGIQPFAGPFIGPLVTTDSLGVLHVRWPGPAAAVLSFPIEVAR
jgi:hypothetical protein